MNIATGWSTNMSKRDSSLVVIITNHASRWNDWEIKWPPQSMFYV